MKEGRKIYSLLLKAESGEYYRIKIDEDYRNPLAVIDAYTVTYPSKDALCAGYSYKLKTKIVDARIVYQKQEKTKSIEPIFAAMEELGKIALDFGKSSEIDVTDYKVSFRIHLFAKKLMDDYYHNVDVRDAFDRYGDYIVRDALMNKTEGMLISRLCEYRKLRKSMLLKKKIELGEKVDVYPLVVDLSDANIIKSDERNLELVESEINDLQNEVFSDSTLQQGQALKLEELYTRREALLISLDRKEDKNQIPGQTKMMF